ncbi:MAG: hypothetical protein M3N29_09880 [Chloroflexota bacterium]|nr:hypothetical protein [Chloroflexota bacterium]
MQLPWTRQSSQPTNEPPKFDLPKIDVSAAASDARRAVSDGAEQVAAVAADVSREAAKLGKDAAKAGRQAIKAGREAARKAGGLAVTGEATLRNLGADAKAAADDLRSVRIVRKRGPDWRPGMALFAGISAGVAAMFFFDPEQGRRRRALLMDQVRKWTRLSSEWVDGKVRDIRNRSIGAGHEVRRAAEGATESAARTSEAALEDVAAATPDVSGELADTDAGATIEPTQPSYVSERTH